MSISITWEGLVMWDLDGSLVPDSELRNQRGIQTTLNQISSQNGHETIYIDWKIYGGNSEDRIYRMLAAVEGNEHLEGLITPADFKAKCLEYFETHDPDFTPREGAIEVMLALRSFNIGSVIVSNSEARRVDRTLIETFNVFNQSNGTDLKVEDVFPIVIDSDDFEPNQLKAKPSQQPYHYGLLQASILKGAAIHKSTVLIFEDSLPGTTSATKFISAPEASQVIQFIDVGARNHPDTIHHMTSIEDSIPIICARFGIEEQDLRQKVSEINANCFKRGI